MSYIIYSPSEPPPRRRRACRYLPRAPGCSICAGLEERRRGEKRSAAVMRPLKVSLDDVKVTAADGRLFPEADFQITLTCYGKPLFKDAVGQSGVSALVCSSSFKNVMQVVANMQKWF